MVGLLAVVVLLVEESILVVAFQWVGEGRLAQGVASEEEWGERHSSERWRQIWVLMPSLAILLVVEVVDAEDEPWERPFCQRPRN